RVSKSNRFMSVIVVVSSSACRRLPNGVALQVLGVWCLHEPAGVDGKCHAGDSGSPLRAQEQCRLGDVPRFDESPQCRGPLDCFRIALPFCDFRLEPFRKRISRCYRVYTHAMWAKFCGKDLRKRKNRVLARRIGRQGKGRKGGKGTHVQYGASAGGAHQPAKYLASEQGAAIIHAPEPLVFIQVLIEHMLAALENSGRVDQDVRGAERALYPSCQFLHRGCLAYVRLNEQGGWRACRPAGSGRFLTTARVTSCNHHPCAVLCETKRDSLADSGRAADHDSGALISHCCGPCVLCRRIRTLPGPGSPSWGDPAGSCSRFPEPSAARRFPQAP